MLGKINKTLWIWLRTGLVSTSSLYPARYRLVVADHLWLALWTRHRPAVRSLALLLPSVCNNFSFLRLCWDLVVDSWSSLRWRRSWTAPSATQTSQGRRWAGRNPGGRDYREQPEVTRRDTQSHASPRRMLLMLVVLPLSQPPDVGHAWPLGFPAPAPLHGSRRRRRRRTTDSGGQSTVHSRPMLLSQDDWGGKNSEVEKQKP